MTHPTNARVFLVGAGPGDPGYITLRGVECLALADVVLYDYLVNPAILRHARADAELICLGQHARTTHSSLLAPRGEPQSSLLAPRGEPHSSLLAPRGEPRAPHAERGVDRGRSRIWSQDEINAELIRLGRAGKQVVRLKSGDPTIFARAAEELDALNQAGVPYEIVPGVTAAIAAGSCAGIPLTHRDYASAVALITGHEDPGKETSSLDYEALARFPGTLVFYMGVTTVRDWTAALIAAGKPPQTPAAIVRRCSFPDQRTILCRLDEVAAKMNEPPKLRPPAIVVVGDVSHCAQQYAWFDKRPLFGQKIVVTRPLEQCDDLGRPLAELGAEVLYQPAIRIEPPEDGTALDAALARLQQFDWLVFSSSNGVRALMQRLLAIGLDLRALGGTKIAVIGPGTAEELGRYHLKADAMPRDRYRAESLAAELISEARGKRFLLARASRGREVLADELTAAGGIVEQVVVYRSEDVAQADERVAELLKDGKIAWITVTSSAIARSLAALFGDDLRKARLASISPITSATLRELGYEPTAEAREYTMQGVVEAIRGK